MIYTMLNLIIKHSFKSSQRHTFTGSQIKLHVLHSMTHPVVRKLHDVFSHCVCMLILFGWPPCQRPDYLNGCLPTCIRFIIYQEYMVILYWCVFVYLIWYLYTFWLTKHCLSLGLSLITLTYQMIVLIEICTLLAIHIVFYKMKQCAVVCNF